MAGINDYSNTAGSNTTINGIDIAEGCSPAGINNAIRQLMADIADMDDGVVPLQTPDINGGTIDGAVIGGTTPAAGTFTNLTATGTLTGLLGNVVEDVTPQLGGDLDLNSNDITGTGNINITGTATVSGDLTVDTNTLFVDASANTVGIGTTSPASELQIGSLTPTITASTKSISLGGTYSNSVGSNPKLKLYDDGTNYMALGVSANRLDFTNSNSLYDFVFYGGGSEVVRIEGTGNVGIGTSSPSAALEVNGGTDNEPIQVTSTDAGSYIAFADDSTTGSTRLGAVGNDFKVDVNSSERMRIDSSGNVGIGVVNPAKLVQINGASGGNGHLLISTDGAFSGTDTATIGLRVYENVSNAHNAQCEIQAVGDGIYSANLLFKTAQGGSDNLTATERMRIDRLGRVMIGTTTVGESSADDLTIATTGQTGITIRSGTANAGAIYFSDATSGTGQYSGYIYYGHSNNTLGFATNSTERMRIDSSGNLLVGCTSIPNVGVSGQYGTSSSSTEVVISKNTSGTTPALYIRTSGGASKTPITFYNDTTQVGSITTTTSSTAYNTSSDYRLKENVVDITSATERLKQLQPKRFNFIADADTTVDGFLAHEVSDIVPEAISGTKDEVEVWKEGEELPEGVSVGDNKLDDEGNTIPKYQGIDQSKLVPLLVASLKEALTEIDNLKARVDTLEGN